MECSIPGLPVHHLPGVYSNSCPLSQWCHPIVSSSIVPFSSCLHMRHLKQSLVQSKHIIVVGRDRLRWAALEDKPPNLKDLIPKELFPSYMIVWCALDRAGLLKVGDLDAQVASYLTLYHLKHVAFKATLVSMEHCLVSLMARNDFTVWPLCEWLRGAKVTSAHILLART